MKHRVKRLLIGLLAISLMLPVAVTNQAYAFEKIGSGTWKGSSSGMGGQNKYEEQGSTSCSVSGFSLSKSQLYPIEKVSYIDFSITQGWAQANNGSKSYGNTTAYVYGCTSATDSGTRIYTLSNNNGSKVINETERAKYQFVYVAGEASGASSSGSYYYEWMDNTGSYPAITYSVMGPSVPTFSANVPSSLTLSYGQQSVITVTATEDPTYQWQISKTGADDSWTNLTNKTYNKTNFDGTKTATLEITAENIEYSDYFVRCVVSNGAGTINSNACKLNYNINSFIPKIGTDLPESLSYEYEDFVTLTTGWNGNAEYKWQVSDSGSEGSWRYLADETSPELVLGVMMDTSHNGKYYRCEASNDAGTVYSSACHMEAVKTTFPVTITAKVKDGVVLRDETTYTKDQIAGLVIVATDGGILEESAGTGVGTSAINELRALGINWTNTGGGTSGSADGSQSFKIYNTSTSFDATNFGQISMNYSLTNSTNHVGNGTISLSSLEIYVKNVAGDVVYTKTIPGNQLPTASTGQTNARTIGIDLSGISERVYIYMVGNCSAYRAGGGSSVSFTDALTDATINQDPSWIDMGGEILTKDRYYVITPEDFYALSSKDEGSVAAKADTIKTEEISSAGGVYQKRVMFVSYINGFMSTATVNFTVAPDPDAIYTDWVPGREYETVENGIRWKYVLDENGNIIYFYTTDTNFNSLVDANGSLNLPVTVNGLPVVGIGGGDSSKPVLPMMSDSWARVRSINIPYTVQSINECAFYGSNGEADVVIPSTVTNIASKAFYHSGIKSLDISNTNADQIPYRAFADCDNLKSIKISGDTIINKEAFAGCDELKDVEINGNISIMENAFKDDRAIKKLYLPSGVNVNAYGFAGCTGLTDLQLGINTVENYAFDGCTNIRNLILENTVSVVRPYWAGSEGTYADRNIYVNNKNTRFMVSGTDSAFGGNGSNVKVYSPDNADSQGDFSNGNCALFASEGEPYNAAKGKATSIEFSATSDVDKEISDNGDDIVNPIGAEQTGIEAHYAGNIIEKFEIKKANMTVLRRYGLKTGEEYAPNEFYIIRLSDYNILKNEYNLTEEAVKELEPIIPTAADLNGQNANTIDVVAIVFDENGTTPINKLDTVSQNHYATVTTVRVEAYNADNVITGFGSYQDILDKLEALDREIAALEGKKDAYEDLINKYKDMIDELNKALAEIGVDEEGNPIDVPAYIAQLEEELAKLKEATGKDSSEGVADDIAALIEEINGLKEAYDKLSDKTGADAEQLRNEIAEKEELLNALEIIKAEMEALEKQLETANAITDHVAELKNQIDELNGRIDDLIKENEDLTGENESLTEENESLTKENEDLTAEKEGLVKDLADLTDAYKDLLAKKNELANELAQAKEDYNNLAQELENLEENYKDKMVGYIGSDRDGNMFVYLDGVACPFDDTSGTEHTYVDENGGKHSVKVYDAVDPDGNPFEFFTMLDGIYVLNGDGYTIYRDTLSETLAKANDMIADLNRRLLALSGDINDIIDILNNAGVPVVKGANDGETMNNIKDAVNDVLKDYQDMKDDYINLKQAIFGDLPKEELDQKTLAELIEKINSLSSETGKIEAEIESAITGGTVSKEDAKALSALLDDIRKMREALAADNEKFASMKELLKLEGDKDALSGIRDLLEEINILKDEIGVLKDENKFLKEELEGGGGGSSSKIKELQEAVDRLKNSVNSLESADNNFNNQLSNVKNTADTAKGTADNAYATATAIKGTADTAKATADSAKSTADSASSTANSAKTTANSALSAAQSNTGGASTGQLNTLQSTVGSLSGKVTALESQNAALQSELNAVKTAANTRTNTGTTANTGTTTNNRTQTTTETTTTNERTTANNATTGAGTATTGTGTATTGTGAAAKVNPAASTTPTTATPAQIQTPDTEIPEGRFSAEAKMSTSNEDEDKDGDTDVDVVETKSSKKGIIILVVLLILVIAGLGFMAYKFFGKKKEEPINDIGLDEEDDIVDDFTEEEEPDIDDSDDDDFNF